MPSAQSDKTKAERRKAGDFCIVHISFNSIAKIAHFCEIRKFSPIFVANNSPSPAHDLYFSVSLSRNKDGKKTVKRRQKDGKKTAKGRKKDGKRTATNRENKQTNTKVHAAFASRRCRLQAAPKKINARVRSHPRLLSRKLGYKPNHKKSGEIPSKKWYWKSASYEENAKNLPRNLVISRKSSNFAPAFEKKRSNWSLKDCQYKM